MTVRLAWHDNAWNGRVCLNPQHNHYCTGSHSLLSERIARNKKDDLEQKCAGQQIDKLPDDYVPPCYWSVNAFSTTEVATRHDHPFQGLKVRPISEPLPSFSAFTWPFRLSFNHSKSKKRREGSYPPPQELSRRIDEFRLKFKAGESLVFFYLNYDNPISAEENKYALVGCGVLRHQIPMPPEFRFDQEELKRLRSKHENKNFPTINWALRVSVDPDSTIILPYREYLARIDEDSDSEEARERLEEIRVLIEEKALVPSFKYVANELDQDGCIYILYKLKRSLKIIEEHGYKDVSRELDLVEKLLRHAWQKRGLFPSLPLVVDLIGGYEPEEGIGNQLVDAVQQNLAQGQDLLNEIFQLLTSDFPIPSHLEHLASHVDDLRGNMADWEERLDPLKKLSLFTLTSTQIKRIVTGERETFKRSIDPQEIVQNPYVLAEEYVDTWEEEHLDLPEIPDGPIGVFKIDVGMFPDPRYLRRNPKLQNLAPSSPERLRAIIIDFLYEMGKRGDCYTTSKAIYSQVTASPLFYKSELNVSQTQLESLESRYGEHFRSKLKAVQRDENTYYYLREVALAEEIVRKTVTELLEDREDYKISIKNLKRFLGQECDKVRKLVGKTFDRKDQRLFLDEREKLLRRVLAKSLYVITGKPGSGKTKVLGKIVSELVAQNEQVVVVALTGKAALRLQATLKEQGIAVEAQTIDRYLHSVGYGKYLEDIARLPELLRDEGLAVDNLIIDECSMVDLQRFAVLFGMLKRNDKEQGKLRIHRIILVGDENQLPPIGFGKPFFDIIEHIKESKNYRESHYIHLRSNCRQGLDETILEIADIFRAKNRYYEERIEKLTKGGQISPGLEVLLWEKPTDLHDLVGGKLDQLLQHQLSKKEFTEHTEKGARLRILFGLYPNGHVPDNSPQEMRLDSLQILTSYRGGEYGTIGLNDYLKEEYKVSNNLNRLFNANVFSHADKIIRINNWYAYDPERRRRTLRLSNGSIGVVCNKRKPDIHREYYFTDQDDVFKYIDDEENFELAYAITVHKSQGNDFSNVFLVVPRRSGLLNKELMYTAFTRSRGKLTLFLQKRGDASPLDIARTRSAILERNTSIFTDPEDHKTKYWPAKNVHVRSKIEYILYHALDQAQKAGKLDFEYEGKLELKHKRLVIHPDFTVQIGKRTYYWEHLGELDIEYYSKNWQQRKRDYEASGLLDRLLTTDDLEGVREEAISQIIEDMMRGKLRDTPKDKFSEHHYQLHHLSFQT
jgi:exodeoxyribonuclease V alpha subunit